MGAATLLSEAGHDERVAALILDSMHAQITVSVGRVLETEHGLPPLPGSWAIIAGVRLRTGVDVTTVDPLRTITRLGDRPVLLLHGALDRIDQPAESADLNAAAGRQAGVPVELHYCEAAGHGGVIDACPTQWADWAIAFLDAARSRGR